MPPTVNTSFSKVDWFGAQPNAVTSGTWHSAAQETHPALLSASLLAAARAQTQPDGSTKARTAQTNGGVVARRIAARHFEWTGGRARL